MMIKNIFELLNVLGSEWVLWILMGLMLVSVYVVVDRYRAIRKQDLLGSKLWEEQVDHWIVGNAEGEPSLMANIETTYPCIEGQLVGLVMKSSESKEKLELKIASFLGRAKLQLEAKISFLGTLGSNAPFIGLFGTVLGIIRAFHEMALSTQGGAQILNAGLSEALVATATGLCLAIPSILFFNYFQRKVKTVIARAENLSNFLLSQK